MVDVCVRGIEGTREKEEVLESGGTEGGQLLYIFFVKMKR